MATDSIVNEVVESGMTREAFADRLALALAAALWPKVAEILEAEEGCSGGDMPPGKWERGVLCAWASCTWAAVDAVCAERDRRSPLSLAPIDEKDLAAYRKVTEEKYGKRD